MQMFGIGILEVMVVMILAVLVVGPERLPQVSAELAQWVRRGRAYARHLTQDFNEVVLELEQEVGASKEDWQEIADVVSDQAEDVEREFKDTQKELKDIDREEAKLQARRAAAEAASSNGAQTGTAAQTDSSEATDEPPSNEAPVEVADSQAEELAEGDEAEDKPLGTFQSRPAAAEVVSS